MNYSLIYNNLIEKAKSRNYKSYKYRIGKINPEVYVETHHIIPKCVGGSNNKSNLVVLTAREHFVAHRLLTKMYSLDKIYLAFFIMLNRTKGKSSRLYNHYRDKFSKAASNSQKLMWTEEKRKEASVKFKTQIDSEEFRKKISDAVKLANNCEEVKKSRSLGLIKRWKNLEYRMKKCEQSKNFWTLDKRVEASNRVKLQNKDNNLKQKRCNAIKKHMFNKPDSWKIKMSTINKIRMNSKEEKMKYSSMYEKSNFNNSRSVLDITTNIKYKSCKHACDVLNLNYSTVKKWLYKGLPKHNLIWVETNKGEKNGK